ncbi:hypothetical protein [Parachlamydia sp. AcF125]|uniref:hypothetical protein n=1 Tax=Parachlamydia sp. AcF125 TaxID=2795736 RepID=UPI001BCA1E32|nr:hypothetical protein [Parachlamydia sp. AcF125]MBS4168083.1 hypothetical protein [Parachlamydia sp. AcF125]
MLTLSSKLTTQEDYLSQNYKVVFNTAKNKLTFRTISKANDITNLQTIVESVNALKKPIFTDIETYRACHAHLKSINKVIDRYNNQIFIKIFHVIVKAFTGGKRGLKKDKISLKEFNQNLAPDATELKKRIWAVHATNHLPEDGILRPFSELMNALPDTSEVQETPSAISNTIHFALGELVRPRIGFSRESHTIAVLTPLGTLMDQAVNIFAYDTFITQKWALKPESILLVPDEENLPNGQDLPFTVVRYNKNEKNLRTAIDEIIQDRGGLAFKMLDNSGILGSPALLDEDINVNTPFFFKNLLEEYEGKLSFGDHSHSSTGDASLLGLIKLANSALMDNHLNSHSPKLAPAQQYLYYQLLMAFYHKAKDKYFSFEDQERFEKTILDKLKMDPVPLTQQHVMQYLSADCFSSLDKEELDQFIFENPQLFESYHQEIFEGCWAHARWLTVGYEQGLKEGLDKIVDQGFLKAAKMETLQIHSVFLMLMNLHAKKYSDRAKVVNHILDLKGIKAYKNRLGLLLRINLKLKGFPFPSKVK